MPLIPTGLTDGLFNRIRDRVRNELGGEPSMAGDPSVQPDLEPEPGLMQNIQDRVRNFFRMQPTPEQARPQNVYTGPARTLHEKMARIQAAARERPPVQLQLQYNGTWRYVEPYSYRYRAKDNPAVPLFFGFCDMHQTIHSFLFEKIQDVQVTEVPYNARWTVEL